MEAWPTPGDPVLSDTLPEAVYLESSGLISFGGYLKKVRFLRCHFEQLYRQDYAELAKTATTTRKLRSRRISYVRSEFFKSRFSFSSNTFCKHKFETIENLGDERQLELGDLDNDFFKI